MQYHLHSRKQLKKSLPLPYSHLKNYLYEYADANPTQKPHHDHPILQDVVRIDETTV